MMKFTNFYMVLVTLAVIAQTSCATQPTIYGLWQDTKEAGTIEFKENGKVIVVDNMSATVIGHYMIENDDLLKLELTASDILQTSIQPSPKITVAAKIIKLGGHELQFTILGEDEVQFYKRIR